MLIKFIEIEAADSDSTAVAFDRHSGQHTVFVLRDPFDTVNGGTDASWTFNRGKGVGEAKRRVVVPLFSYKATKRLQAAAELAIMASNLAAPLQARHGVAGTHRAVVVLCDGGNDHVGNPRLLCGLFIEPDQES